MEDTRTEVLDFLEKCEQLRKSKFIMATTRIKDILKSIVNSRALYELFHTVTADFDYVTAKRRCLVTSHEGFLSRNRLILPDTVGDRLAFIFCLLVEFDHDSINFNEFLQRFFAEDGSYYSSFHSFCDKVIVNLEELIRDIFSEELADGAPSGYPSEQGETAVQSSKTSAGEKISAVSILISREKQIISSSAMAPSEKQDGFTMLSELEKAVREGRADAADAILRGYEYYSACHNNFSELFELLSAALQG